MRDCEDYGKYERCKNCRMHKRPMSKRRIILLIVLGVIVLLIAGTAVGFAMFVRSGGYQLLDDVLTMDNVERVTLTYGNIGYELELRPGTVEFYRAIAYTEDLRVYFWSIDTDMNWNVSETVIFGGPPPVGINFYLKDGSTHRVALTGTRYFFKHNVYNIVVDGTSYITDGWRIEELAKFVEPYVEELIEGNKEYQQQ